MFECNSLREILKVPAITYPHDQAQSRSKGGNLKIAQRSVSDCHLLTVSAAGHRYFREQRRYAESQMIQARKSDT